MIQEFGISITAVGGDQYLVRTENVEKGVQLAEERVHWPVAQWLEQTKSLMHDPLLGLLQGQQSRAIPTRAGSIRRSNPGGETGLVSLVQLGQTLHNELFRGQLHDSWITAQGVAQNHQDLLRLRIGIKDNRLQQLPWEALHAGTRPLATGTDVIFSRYILDPRQEHSIPQVKPSTIGQVLRILMVIASPEDQERLELKQEVHHLQAELEPDEIGHDDSVVDVRLKILEQPGRAELTQELERGNYQVLHYAGHSNLGNAGGDLYLVSRQTGLTERLSGEDLAGLLVNNGIKLAVFNSCRGGYSSSSEEGWQERNLAQALVNRGMPGVIAMTERIPDHVAITFTELLYRNLKKGQSIDLSLNRTRQGLISAYGSNQFYWALPTLYMHPLFDGYLVRTTGDLENTDVLDSANDPFGDMFSEPGLSEIDLPVRQRPPIAVDSMVMRSKQADKASGQSMSGQSASEQSVSAGGKTDKQPLVSAQASDSEIAAKAAIKKLSTPLSTVDVDGELQVPEDIETPEGFYGELTAVAPAMPSLEQATISTSTSTAKDKSVPAENDVPELVGERLTRSHTVHTRLLTVPGIATMVLIGLLGVTTVAWAQRALRTPRREPVPETLGELGLPAQIEVALNQNDLDAAAVATKALIDKGEYLQAIAALETADRRQQEDVIVSFFRGRAQWGLAKQGRDNFSADDA
ncbi:MAG: CHAT domain-containing protein, partial [Cyanobacteria bacterium J06623_5]